MTLWLLVALTLTVGIALSLLIIWGTQTLTRRVLILASIPFVALYAAVLLSNQDTWWLSSSLVLIIGGLLGSAIGRDIRSSGSLIAFGVTVAIVDILSFLFGPTDAIIDGFREGRSLLLQNLSLSVPVRGRTQPVAGIGDFFILSAFVQSLLTVKAAPLAAFLVPSLGLLLALPIGLLVGGIFAAPFMALWVVAYILLARRPEIGGYSDS